MPEPEMPSNPPEQPPADSTALPEPGPAPAAPEPPRRSPDAWALEKFGQPDPRNLGGRLLPPVKLLLLAGMKVHCGCNAEGDLLTEADFDKGWAAYAALPLGR